MIVIADMQMPENCQTCPFSHKVHGFAACIAKARYESPDNGGTFSAAILHDGNGEQRDSTCPLYDDTTIDAALEEIKRLRGELERLTGECSTAAP